MLEIRGLHKIYGKYHALSGLALGDESPGAFGL